MSDYKEVVKEMIQKEEQMCGDLLQDAMEHIGMNEQEFMQMSDMRQAEVLSEAKRSYLQQRGE